jgi:hypothetical protein
MHIRLDCANAVHLHNFWDFHRFSLVVEQDDGGIELVRQILSGLAMLPNTSTAWVFESALRRREEIADNADWQRELTLMIEKAKPLGWFDATMDAIKAHVVWQAAGSPSDKVGEEW